MNLNEISKLASENAKQKGFHGDNRTIGDVIALMHSELSEALEEYRNGRMETWFSDGGKPEGFGVELADCVIRIADTCGTLGFDLEQLIKIKMEYNSTRPFKHGGRKI